MARPEAPDQDWLGLSEASRVLGVSPATLRRWSDAGRLHVFTTPGGHRRFSRAVLERLLPSDRTRRPALGGAGLTPSRIARTYRRAGREVAAGAALGPDPDRRAASSCSASAATSSPASLLQHLDAAQPEGAAHHLKEASVSAGDYGRMAAGMGLSLSQTIEGFLRFRAPFHHELAVAARRRGFDAAETSDLLETAERAMDRLLVATMTGHSLATGRRRREPGPGLASPRSSRDERTRLRVVVALVSPRPRTFRPRSAKPSRPDPGRAPGRAADCRDLPPGRGLLDRCDRRPSGWPELAGSRGRPTLVGDAAARHAIEVAVGRDSVVVGEDQVLHQVRESVEAARRAGRLDPASSASSRCALQAGRQARSLAPGPSRSLADVALAAIERKDRAPRRSRDPRRGRRPDGPLDRRRRQGRRAPRSSIANRSADRAAPLAAATGVAHRCRSTRVPRSGDSRRSSWPSPAVGARPRDDRGTGRRRRASSSTCPSRRPGR